MDWKTVNTNCYDKVVIPEEQKHTLAYISAIFDIFKEDGVCETCKHRDKSLDWHRLKGLSPPSLLFGGTWEQIEDTFLLASGSAYAAGDTGGSADAVVVKHNHTQNSHNHTQNAHTHTGASGRAFVTNVSGKGIGESRFTAVSSGSTYTVRFESGDNWWGVPDVGNTTATNQAATATNKEAGVDGKGKNMPPYLAVYMWQRIA